MKKLVLLSFTAFIGLNFMPGEEIKTIELGTICPMPDSKMKSIGGNEVSLNDKKQANGLLVIFSCNTCPFVVGDGEGSAGWEGRYNKVNEIAKANQVGMVLVNSNHAKREKGDGLTDMINRAKEKGYTMDYVLDEASVLANAFGARTTPHVFLFDKNMKLVYRGAIDDNVKSADQVRANYLERAITALAAGKRIKMNDTKAVGCSIKRVAK